MSMEEIIKNLQNMVTMCDAGATVVWDKWIETAREAIAKLKTHQDYQPNEPLTREELREMAGKAVFLSFPDRGEWVLIRFSPLADQEVGLIHSNGLCSPLRIALECGGRLYRRPPKEST